MISILFRNEPLTGWWFRLLALLAILIWYRINGIRWRWWYFLKFFKPMLWWRCTLWFPCIHRCSRTRSVNWPWWWCGRCCTVALEEREIQIKLTHWEKRNCIWSIYFATGRYLQKKSGRILCFIRNTSQARSRSIFVLMLKSLLLLMLNGPSVSPWNSGMLSKNCDVLS